MKKFILGLKKDLQCEDTRHNAIFLSIVTVILIIGVIYSI